MVSKFNPAFYVSFSADGEKELDLVAKMLWFQHAYPGWRVVSDGMDIFTFKDQDDTPVTILLGHVAAINQDGIRVSSVPASVLVTDSLGECAQDFFQTGASVLLDMLGMTVYNITSEQWSEFWKFKNGWSSENQSRGMTNIPSHAVVKPTQTQEYIPPAFEGKQFVAQQPNLEKRDDTLAKQKMEPSKESPVMDFEMNADNIMKIFADIIVKAPREIPSYVPGTPVDEQQLQKLFDRFCLVHTGASWDIADEVERGQIMDKMLKILENSR